MWWRAYKTIPVGFPFGFQDNYLNKYTREKWKRSTDEIPNQMAYFLYSYVPNNGFGCQYSDALLNVYFNIGDGVI